MAEGPGKADEGQAAVASLLADALAKARVHPGVARLVERLPHRLVLSVDGASWTVAAGDAGASLTVAEGHEAPQAEVVVDAPAGVWREMLSPLPRSGRQSAGAALRAGCGFAMHGEPLAVAQSLPLLESLIEAMRAAVNGHCAEAVGQSSQVPAPDRPALDRPALDGSAIGRPEIDRPALDRITSGYREIDWPEGDRCWVFEESAGAREQPVLLLLHTAGADSRQWHALMTDERLTRQWRLMAFDLPCHGRSYPPQGWKGEPWQLDTERYLDCIRAWMRANDLERIALAGCSMGAAIGLAFLARYPELAFGAILLETPCRSPGRRTPMLDHPAVHGGRFGAAWVQALLSPYSPARERRLATWIYSQAAPGVYEGDLAFYSDEFDAARFVDAIDTARTPLWLLSGEYDYSATPEDARRVADAVPGARFVRMDGLGHFPMTENPARLLEHFEPAARALRSHVATTASESGDAKTAPRAGDGATTEKNT